MSTHTQAPNLDIHDRLIGAIRWAESRIPCDGCTAATPGASHSPLCLISHEITTALGDRGRVVVLDPHPSAQSRAAS